MLTQCPHCLTLFRIGPEQLKIAAGKVRCSRCNQVFNALHRLEETPESFQQNDLIEEEEYWRQRDDNPPDTNLQMPDTQEHPETGRESGPREAEPRPDLDEVDTDTERDFIRTFDLEPDTESILTHDDELIAESDFILEQDDGLETEPDYFATETESQMSALLDQDSIPDPQTDETEDREETEDADDPAAAEIIDFVRNDEQEAEEATEEDSLPPGFDFGDSILKDEELDLAEGKPDYDSVPAFRTSIDLPPPPQTPTVDESIFSFEEAATPAKRRSISMAWLVGSLILLLLLGGQLAWQFREGLIQHELGRQILSGLCTVTGCQVPIRRATDKIIIQGRNLSSHPDQPDVLFMQLSMVNTAPFEQPYPKVQLSLFNDKGKLITRRTFKPQEYLPRSEQGNSMMPMARPILVEMHLVDPGKEVTGFTFDFL